MAAAEAQARSRETKAGYALLLADADGTVVETLAEPGQVVAAGQTVVKLAHPGRAKQPSTCRNRCARRSDRLRGRRSIVFGPRRPGALRQLSDAADPATATFEARYLLEGEAAQAPLGATVTISIDDVCNGRRQTEVPLGAIYDDGRSAGVWVVDPASSAQSPCVRFKSAGSPRRPPS